MRALLVDNHDSFTYNLFQVLAELTGTRPVVVRNDDPDFHIAELAAFDAVVISPGPGHPGVPGDFGLSADVLAAARQPLLGVCLGHQGLCLAAGATVGPAPAVRHGRESLISHDGTDLFAGLPSPMPVIRYHSLAVTDLPDELVPTAWAEDGVLMAVRHRDRPAWGVQFHPESIGTAHGRDLMANFVRLAGGARSAIDIAPAVPPPPATRRVVSRRVPVRVSAEHVFDALYRDADHAFWLDSSTGDHCAFLGDATGPLAAVATADVWTGAVTVTRGGRRSVVRSGFFDWLDAQLSEPAIVPDLPFDFALGWVGYLGYELKAECGGDRVHRSQDPDATLIFADRAVAVDQRDGVVYLLALVDADHDQEDWLTETADALRRLPPLAEPGHGPVQAGQIRLRHNRSRYLELIERGQRAELAGESYEVCLTNEVTAVADLNPWPAYRTLRGLSPSPFAAFLRLGALSVLSSSPERLLRIGADGTAEACPIKGTRPRGATAEQDARLRAELAKDEKERAENLMIVDLLRNDLGRCARIGSVHVPALCELRSFATVHHLVSTIRATLSTDASAVDCVRAVFPGGSMTGAPKERTMSILDTLEAGPRGVYSGAIGYFSLSGAVDLSVVIRTLIVRPGEVSFGVGGAITALSDPVAEFEETAVKAAALLRLLGAEFPGRKVNEAS